MTSITVRIGADKWVWASHLYPSKQLGNLTIMKVVTEENRTLYLYYHTTLGYWQPFLTPVRDDEWFLPSYLVGDRSWPERMREEVRTTEISPDQNEGPTTELPIQQGGEEPCFQQVEIVSET